MIYIGNQTSAWAASPTEPFDYAVANGFDAFEWFPDKKPDAGWEENDLNQSQRNLIRQTASERSIRLSVHAPWQGNPLQPDSAPILAKDVELAQNLGAALLNIHLFHQAGLEAYVRAITPLIELTAKAQLQLAIENTPDHAPEQFNDLFRILARLKHATTSHVGMCLDLGHANLCAATRNDYVRFLDRLSSEVPIIHLHLHENWGDADTHLPLFTGPAGRDESGIRAFLQRIQKRGFSGSIILEQWPNPPSLLNNARDRLLKLLGEQNPSALCGAQLPTTPAGAQPLGCRDPGDKPAAPENAGHDQLGGSCSLKAAPRSSALAANDSFAAALVAVDKRSRSWREKLDSLRGVLAEQKSLKNEQLVDTAIYLRFLGTGQIPCVEDGRHFRPGHHASIALDIYRHLTSSATPETTCLVRKILPWLPSTAEPFRRAEPLTRIRDIAHRNDIPSELKRELKQSLQNKLHRCAGPEDLATADEFLKRFTDPGANYPPAFVEEFKLFHNELKEFFNASSVEDRLKTLLPKAPSEQAALITAFLGQKADHDFSGQLTAFATLTELRRSLLENVKKVPEPDSQEVLLTDIKLEEFAFALLSTALNTLEANLADASQLDWPLTLSMLSLILRNLSLSSVAPEECGALLSELEAWLKNFDQTDRNQLLRLKASADRARRLAETVSEGLLTLLPQRARLLGSAMGVPEHAVRVFAEAEVRSHIVFQLSKLVSLLLRRIRQQLSLPAWDVLVSGQSHGRLVTAESLAQLHRNSREPVIALLNQAEGDEEIPTGIVGIVLAHELPHLSHLAVRARQAKVVFVACEESRPFANLAELTGQNIELVASAENVDWKPVSPAVSSQSSALSKPVKIPPVRLKPERTLLRLDQVAHDNSGGKAYGVRRLSELSQQSGSGFLVPPALAIPFGIMEASLAAQPALETKYWELISGFDAMSQEQATRAAQSLRDLIRQLRVPEEILSGVAKTFDPDARLIVRSSANCEDLEQFAGAGLYDSVANVDPNDIAAAVRTVWSSLWSRRAASSRNQAGIPHDQDHMAVLIQQMLTPDYSFVLHTVNPISHKAGELYAELAVGLGETLASAAERGTPYRLLCDKQSGTVTTLAVANFSHGLFPTASGLERRTIDYSKVSLSHDSKLRETLGRQLAQIGRFIENAFGQPQDIEGALVGTKIYLVQARPQQGLA